MSKIYKFGISGSVVLVCLGWLLNCAALRSEDSLAPVPVIDRRNVVCSEWFDASEWVKSSVFGLPARVQNLAQPDLTLQRLEEGQLYVYTKIDAQVKVLPFTLTTPDAELRFDYTTPTNAHLRLVEIGLKGPLKPIDNQQFRYIVLPNKLVDTLPIDMNNYAAVQAALGLAD